MAAPKRSHTQMLVDRERTWELKLCGYGHSEITRILNAEKAPAERLSREQIVYDVRQMEKAKVAALEELVSLHRATELDRLTMIIREAARGWERSTTERRRSRTRTGSELRPGRATEAHSGASAVTGRQDRRERNEAIVDVEERAGDARFLNVMLQATSKRIELLGLVDRERGPDISDEPVRLIVIRRDVALEPSNSDFGDDAGLETVEGQYRETRPTDVQDEASDDDMDESRIITRPPVMLRLPNSSRTND